MSHRDELRKKLNNYSKEEIIEALLLSNVATGFVLKKCKDLYKKPQTKKSVETREEKNA